MEQLFVRTNNKFVTFISSFLVLSVVKAHCQRWLCWSCDHGLLQQHQQQRLMQKLLNCFTHSELTNREKSRVLKMKRQSKKISKRIVLAAEGHACCIMDAEETDVMTIFHLGGCFCGSDTVKRLQYPVLPLLWLMIQCRCGGGNRM